MNRAGVKVASAVALLLALAVAPALAHFGGQLPIAALSEPERTGTVVDTSYMFRWFDTDRPVMTGTSVIEFRYTSDIPPTFTQGDVPLTLTGTVIAENILETDMTNAVVWDTTQVPTGTYWIWSWIHEPPTELNAIDIITFSPGVLTVAHPGDPVPPAVVVTKPDSAFRTADQYGDLGYSAFDPDGTGRVKLEATLKRDGTDLMLIADDLPAVADGMVRWDTADLPQGDYTIKATITDARGMSFSAFGRFYILVTHLRRVDAGPADRGIEPDASPADAGEEEDTGFVKKPAPSSGCTCVTREDRAASAWMIALLAIGVLGRWRR